MITLNEFVKLVANEYEDTPVEVFTEDTHFRELEEWGSLLSLSIISTIDDELDVIITGAEVRSCTTIADLYNMVQSK